MKLISLNTPDSKFNLILNNKDIAIASGFGPVDDLKKRLPKEFQQEIIKLVKNHPYEQLISSYYEGDKTALNKIPRQVYGTEFQKNIWHVMSQIPFGKTLSYKQLVEKSNNPKAIRAAGTACGKNRLTLLIPCHRILKNDGGIGNYLYGSEIKKSLLQHEKI